MDESLKSISNRDKIAVVVVGYNRLLSIKRLLESLERAEYPIDDVPLVISIDCSGDNDLYNYLLIFKPDKAAEYILSLNYGTYVYDKTIGVLNSPENKDFKSKVEPIAIKMKNELIKNKLSTGRLKDKADVESLRKTN